MPQISIKLLIDKVQNRVVYAEAKGDFIDVLFSFLTLPLGSMVRLLGKQSGLGSLDTLYKSIEQLDVTYLQTEACKEILLKPRSAAAPFCMELKINNLHDVKPTDVYVCRRRNCLIQSVCYYSCATNTRCSRCGKMMDKEFGLEKNTLDKGGIFVKDGAEFVITDDLRVMHDTLFEGLGIQDTSMLEERVVDVDNDKVLNLLRISLVSKHALTRLFFPDQCIEESGKCFLMSKEEIDDGEKEYQMNVKVIFNKKNNSILHAEVGGDFANQVLSFLTFPLGSVFMFLGDKISLEGCVSNLYFSAKRLKLECFVTKRRKKILLNPNIATYYGCLNQLLQLDEVRSKLVILSSCLKCKLRNELNSPHIPPCKHGVSEAKMMEQNPKLKNGGIDRGGGFAKDGKRFLVTDNLQISSISPFSIINEGKNFPISDLVEKEFRVDKAKVLSLLGTMLISKTVLSDVFSDKPAKPTYWQSFLNAFDIMLKLWWKLYSIMTRKHYDPVIELS